MEPACVAGKVGGSAMTVRSLTARTDSGESIDMQETEILSQEQALREWFTQDADPSLCSAPPSHPPNEGRAGAAVRDPWLLRSLRANPNGCRPKASMGRGLSYAIAPAPRAGRDPRRIRVSSLPGKRGRPATQGRAGGSAIPRARELCAPPSPDQAPMSGNPQSLVNKRAWNRAILVMDPPASPAQYRPPISHAADRE